MNKKALKIKKAWPTKKAMEQVYALKLWGDNGAAFYSGEGSHHPEIVSVYVEKVQSFLNSFKPKLSVCDLGCGDFNIGKQLFEYTKQYTAIDIVPQLIAYNNLNFKANNLSFLCLDIATAELPNADCVIIRQVLQHLSNNEIHSILNKLSSFKYIVLTEHLPQGDFEPNKNIISGQGIRIKKQSGVAILAPPFNFKVTTSSELLRYDLGGNKGVIVTMLYEV